MTESLNHLGCDNPRVLECKLLNITKHGSYFLFHLGRRQLVVVRSVIKVEHNGEVDSLKARLVVK